jgi:lipoprotein-anchoring transpeptidase ErfK/SrfK
MADVKNPTSKTACSLPSAVLQPVFAVLAAVGLCQCAGPKPKAPADVVVSVKEQKLALYNRNGSVAREYPVSTSKFGLGDKPGTYGTPLGVHEVVAKIGHGAPAGAVFKSRVRTGEILKPDAPGRDPIVSRIMWLRGMEKINKNAYGRCIYIHGTAEERNVGKPVSYGCIRMKSRDVMDLFNRLPIGSRVLVTKESLPSKVPVLPVAVPIKPEPGTQPPIFLEPKQDRQADPPVEVPMLAQNETKKSSSMFGFLHRGQKDEDTAVEPSNAAPRVAQNRASRSQPVETFSAEPEPAAPTITRQPLPGGGSVLYNAPAGSAPGLVLKSKRSASQGYQN